MEKPELDNLLKDLRKKSDAELIIFRVSKANNSEPAALADAELQRRARRDTLLLGAGAAIAGAIIGALLTFVLQLSSGKPHKVQYFVTHLGMCGGEVFNPGTCQEILNKLGSNGWKLVGTVITDPAHGAMYFAREE